MARLGASVFLSVALYVGALGCAIAVMPIVRWHMAYVTYWYSYGPILYTGWYTAACILSGDFNYYGACQYGYSLGAIGIFFACCGIVIAPCLAERLSGVGMKTVADAFGIAWWLAGAIVMTNWGTDANDNGFPNTSWRNAIIGLSWAAFACFALAFLMDIFSCIKGVRGRGKHHDDHGVKTSAMEAGTGYPTGTAGYPTATYPAVPVDAMPDSAPDATPGKYVK